MGQSNRHHTPYWAVVIFLAVSALVTAAAGAHDQELVLFYAVSVFISFLVGLLAMARFALREQRPWSLGMNSLGASVVAFVLVANLASGQPIAGVLAGPL